jgi:hypothetical protein
MEEHAMQKEYLGHAIGLYHEVESQLSQFSSRARTIENVILIISVVTSGGLWLLAAQLLPQAVLWAGAAFSTLTIGLTLYLYSSGVNKKREKAINLHAEVSGLLARIRGNTNMTDSEFSDTFKSLEHKARTLAHDRD